MRILMLGSDEIRLNEYRYDICRSLLFGEDVEVETTSEGAARYIVGHRRPDLVILDANANSASVMSFIHWLRNLPYRKTVGMKVVLMKKHCKDCETERAVHSLPVYKRIISSPLNVRELKGAIYNYQLN